MRIGPYEVLGEVGRGGVGVVYRVRGPDGSEAALKLLLGADPSAFACFERERRLLASLGEDQGFVGLRDAGVSEGASGSASAWLVMPFVPGGTLRQKLDGGPLGIEETIALGVQLARALGAAHERGIVHRDVKPENVLFTAAGNALIADLGLGKHFDRGAPGASQSLSLTRHGVIKGTVGYMAPEQLVDPRSAGPPADVFALGAVLYECLAGRPAFEGDSPLELLSKVSSEDAEPIARSGVPRWLELVLMSALAREPEDRPADGTRLAQALALRGRAAPLATRRRSRLLPLTLGAAAGVLGLAALAFSLERPARASKPGPAPAQRALERGEERARSGDLEGAIHDFTRAIELDPRLARAWDARASARIRRDDYAGGVADATRAIEIDPGFADAWETRASARINSGDTQGALDDVTRALALAPRFASAWVDRGTIKSMQGDARGALDDLTHAIELDPGNVVAWADRGGLRSNMGDLEGAISDLTKAVELDPNKPLAWSSLGTTRSKLGDLDGALAALARAIELQPRDAGNHVKRAGVLLTKGDAAGGIEESARAIELEPRLAEAWQLRGAAHLLANELEGAVADLTRAIELDPRLLLAWQNRGAARSNAGDLDGAIADLSKAIELGPQEPKSWQSRGITRSRQGDVPGAVADLEHALELDPAGPEAARTRRALEEARARSR